MLLMITRALTHAPRQHMLKLFVLLLLLEECTWPTFDTLPLGLLVYESMTIFSNID